MKKSTQSSDKITVNSSIRHIFSLPTIICLVVFAIILFYVTFFEYGYYDDGSYTLLQAIKGEINTDNPYYYLNARYTDPLFPAFGGILLGIFQFSFLLNKKACLTHLSFGLKRSRIYLYRTLAPLVSAVFIVLSVNLPVAFFNIFYLGLRVNLLKALLVNILAYILPLVFCFTVTVAAHLFTSRKAEAIALTISLLLFPTAIRKLTITIFSSTLFGFGDIYSSNGEIDDFFASIDPIGLSVALEDNFTFFSIKDEINILPIVLGQTVNLALCVGALALFGVYFSKKFKPESSGIKGKSGIALSFISVTIPLFVSFIVLEQFIGTDYYSKPVATSVILYIAIALIISSVCSVLINLIVSLGVKKILCGISGAGVVATLTIIIAVIGYTGCFGFSSYIPETKDISYIDISLPFADFHESMDNTYFDDMSFREENILISDKDDMEIVRNIHKSIVDTKPENETAIYCHITYNLKNGEKITRYFYNISEEASYEYLNLWETKVIKRNYKFLLGQNTADDTEKWREDVETYLTDDYQSTVSAYESIMYEGMYYQNVHDYYGDIYSGWGNPISITDNIYIISKDNKVTDIDKTFNKDSSTLYLRESINLITEALYKDVCTLSAEQWFMPEEQLGALVFASDYSSDYERAAKDLFANYYDVFYINSNMTNTLKVLDELGYTPYFGCKKQVAQAHLVDVNHMAYWMQTFYSYYEDLPYDMDLEYNEQYEQTILHSTHFTQSNDKIYDYLETGCDFYRTTDSYSDYHTELYVDDDYYSDDYNFEQLPPPREEITDLNVARDMVKKSYFSYNVGNNGKFLMVKYTDGTCSMLVIPE
ncbi:MAG: hypothetical protein IJ025_00545 [Clostridia bacterium]|nr:hypothetical protein [Clostridia bacterium]